MSMPFAFYNQLLRNTAESKWKNLRPELTLEMLKTVDARQRRANGGQTEGPSPNKDRNLAEANSDLTRMEFVANFTSAPSAAPFGPRRS